LKGISSTGRGRRSDFCVEAVPGQPGKALPHITDEALYM
jgi:hypothetical protein